jgi:hypothetical protein
MTSPDVREPLAIMPASAVLAPNEASSPGPGRSEFEELTAFHWFMHRPLEPQQFQRLHHQLQQLGVLI